MVIHGVQDRATSSRFPSPPSLWAARIQRTGHSGVLLTPLQQSGGGPGWKPPRKNGRTARFKPTQEKWGTSPGVITYGPLGRGTTSLGKMAEPFDNVSRALCLLCLLRPDLKHDAEAVTVFSSQSAGPVTSANQTRLAKCHPPTPTPTLNPPKR